MQDLQAPEIRTEWLWCAWCSAKHLQHCQSEKPLAMVKTLHFLPWKWSLHFVNLATTYGDDFTLNICLGRLKVGILTGPEFMNIWQNRSAAYQFPSSVLFYRIKTIEKFLFCSQQVLGLLSHYWYYKWKVIRKPGLQKNMQFSTLCCLWKPGQQALMRNHHQAAGLLTLFVNTIFQSLFIGNREKKQLLLLKSFFFVNMWS